MLESQLLHTLRLFEQQELEMLDLYVASPIFQPKHHVEQALKLFVEIKKFYPAFQDECLKKEVIAQQLFARRKNPSFDVTRGMADLLTITHNFINHRYASVHSSRSGAIEQEGNEEEGAEHILLSIRKKLTLMRFYNERLHERPGNSAQASKSDTTPGKKGRNPYRFFENLYSRVINDLNGINDFSDFKEQEFNDYLYFRYLVQHEKSLFDGYINPASGDQNLMAAMEQLDAFYLFQKLNLLSRFINLEKNVNFSGEDPAAYERMSRNRDFMIQVCQMISEGQLRVESFLELFAALVTFRSEKDDYQADMLAKKFIKLLAVYQHSIPETILEEFELQVCNHWTARYQQDREEEFAWLLHEIHLKQVERLKQNKKGVAGSHLSSIVFAALKVHQNDWAKEVLKLLEHRILDAKASLIYSILLTHILFEQKEYAEAAKNLPHYITYGELKDMWIYTIAAKLDIKIRYEMDCLFDDESRMIKATQARLIRDNSLTPAKRKERELFYFLVIKLYRAKEHLLHNIKSNTAKILEEVQAALNGKSKPIDADWLQIKIDELSKIKTGNK